MDITCQRTIKGYNQLIQQNVSRKCGKKATHRQDDGLSLCEHHFNKWKKKNGCKVQGHQLDS